MPRRTPPTAITFYISLLFGIFGVLVWVASYYASVNVGIAFALLFVGWLAGIVGTYKGL